MTISDLNQLDLPAFVATLGWIFEHSPWVAERAGLLRPFTDKHALHAAMVHQVELATHAEQVALLQAHPDLGTRARLSPASTNEQSGAGLDTLTQDEFDQFTSLNTTYRARFGFPFLLAVKGCTKHDILSALHARIESSLDDEFHEALRQVYKIAAFRLEDI